MKQPIVSPFRFDPSVLNRPITIDAVIFWGGDVGLFNDVTVSITTSILIDPEKLPGQVFNLLSALQMIGAEANLPFSIALGEDMEIEVIRRDL